MSPWFCEFAGQRIVRRGGHDFYIRAGAAGPEGEGGEPAPTSAPGGRRRGAAAGAWVTTPIGCPEPSLSGPPGVPLSTHRSGNPSVGTPGGDVRCWFGGTLRVPIFFFELQSKIGTSSEGRFGRSSVGDGRVGTLRKNVYKSSIFNRKIKVLAGLIIRWSLVQIQQGPPNKTSGYDKT
jgi:hypothetical protein